jgi:hypothetical protein
MVTLSIGHYADSILDENEEDLWVSLPYFLLRGSNDTPEPYMSHPSIDHLWLSSRRPVS